MLNVPTEVQSFLMSSDALARAELVHRHPNLLQVLNSSETRAALVEWLSGDEPYQAGNDELTANVLAHLRASAQDSDVPFVKPLLLHSSPLVRLRAYEFLLTLYFPDKNREAMFLLLNSMLTDMEETVRTEAAAYIRRAGAANELRPFLQRWLKNMKANNLEQSESYEQVKQLVEEGDQ